MSKEWESYQGSSHTNGAFPTLTIPKSVLILQDVPACALFSHQHIYSFCFWPTWQFLQTFSEIYWKYAFIKTHRGSREEIVTNKWILEKIILPPVSRFGWSLDFNSPETWFWSWLGSILAVQSTFPNKLLVFGRGYTFLGKDWCTGYQVLFSKMLRLKCQFENLAEINKILLFTLLYELLNNKSMLIPNLRYMLTHRLHINHQKCRLGRHPAPGRRCYAKWIWQLN